MINTPKKQPPPPPPKRLDIKLNNEISNKKMNDLFAELQQQVTERQKFRII